MSTEEKIAKIEEIMELDAGELQLDSRLVDFDEWDSISILSFVAMISDEFDREVSTEEIKKIITVSDALKFMT